MIIRIKGVNFLLADTGAVPVTGNEGNTLLSTGFAKTDIDKTDI